MFEEGYQQHGWLCVVFQKGLPGLRLGKCAVVMPREDFPAVPDEMDVHLRNMLYMATPDMESMEMLWTVFGEFYKHSGIAEIKSERVLLPNDLLRVSPKDIARPVDHHIAYVYHNWLKGQAKEEDKTSWGQFVHEQREWRPLTIMFNKFEVSESVIHIMNILCEYIYICIYCVDGSRRNSSGFIGVTGNLQRISRNAPTIPTKRR